jgi:hypothetical protein
VVLCGHRLQLVRSYRLSAASSRPGRSTAPAAYTRPVRLVVRRPVLTAAVLVSVLWIGWTAHRVAHTLPVVYGYWMWNPDEEIRIIAHESVMIVAALLSVGILGEYIRTELTLRRRK